MFWIPKYLNEARGTSIELIGKLFWIPFLALGVSNMLGGWMSDEILKKTNSFDKARKVVMGFAAFMMLSVLWIRNVQSTEVVVLILAIAFFAHGLWITNYITSISDIFGKTATSTIIGFSGSAGALSALVINPIIGLIVTKFSYDPMWIYAGLMYPVAFLFFIGLIRKIKLREAYT
jgi:ACS family hexuronate transporter-like MFS transporter